MLINRANIETAFTGFKASFNRGFEGAKPSYSRVAMTIPSTSSSENYGWLGQIPKMREWLGDRIVNNLSAHSHTITNRKFENTITVKREEFEDDQYGIFSPLFEEMGKGAKELPDELVYALLTLGFSSKCYDGQYFFDTDHPVKNANGELVSASNSDGGSGSPWFLLDGNRAIKPIIYQDRTKPQLTSLDNDNDENVFWRDEYVYGVRMRANAGFGLWQLAYGSKQVLDATNYAAARASMMSLRGDSGRLLGITPTLLVVGPALEEAARELILSQTRAAGESNPWRDSVELLVTPWVG
ncbi:Mu-like prophage major head subunit gpT [Rhizobium sp. RU35A]|uniref:Mu-like prophage major head subunit gpT family protein n=1 Tax=Rhizobium sp. RU35A TaxID=1907414 RepID=UPI000955D896|nr:Mu-like prophage major head subunit gpT family protein [Rhizobium sp. RU35A]SIQ78059.1 Mu-like prophage major head subunit gpT [Rhizobium sp. RU35A]